MRKLIVLAATALIAAAPAYSSEDDIAPTAPESPIDAIEAQQSAT